MQVILKKHFLLMSIATCLIIPLAKSESSVQMKTLLRTSTAWDGQTYQYPQGPAELSILKITIPANSELTWHKHPMPNVAYMLSGKLTVEKKETGEKKILTAGEVLPELVDQLHRGFAGDQPVELIVFYAGAKGLPLFQHE